MIANTDLCEKLITVKINYCGVLLNLYSDSYMFPELTLFIHYSYLIHRRGSLVWGSFTWT